MNVKESSNETMFTIKGHERIVKLYVFYVKVKSDHETVNADFTSDLGHDKPMLQSHVIFQCKIMCNWLFS